MIYSAVRVAALATLTTGLVLLSGCASSHKAAQPSDNTPAAGTSMTPGMIMPDGSTMGAESPEATHAAGDQPSESASMVCADETRESIKTVLTLRTAPVGRSHWADHLYTCTYTLPMGKLVLSVKESADPASTTAYYTTLRGQLRSAHDLDGLGEHAYGTDDGTVVLRKDNDVLRVNATEFPAEFGAQHQKRSDFAYEIASDILGCWTGD